MKKYGREVALSMSGGSQTRNLHDEFSDVDSKFFVLPTFEDLYTTHIFKKFDVSDKVDEDVQDVRRLERLLYASNPAYLDLLFSRDINTHGSPEMVELVAMRDDIARMNLPSLYNSSLGVYNRAVEDMTRATSEKVQEMINKHGYNMKKAMLAMHFLRVLEKFHAADFKDYGNAIWYEGTERDFMIGMKRGNFTLPEINSILSKQLAIVEDLKNGYHSKSINDETNATMQGHLRQLVERKLKKWRITFPSHLL